jgi:hypothetical protein
MDQFAYIPIFAVRWQDDTPIIVVPRGYTCASNNAGHAERRIRNAFIGANAPSASIPKDTANGSVIIPKSMKIGSIATGSDRPDFV